MLPISGSPDPSKKQLKSPEQKLIDRKSAANSLHSVIQLYLSPFNPRSWLLYSIFFLQILLLLMARSLQQSHLRAHFPSPQPNDPMFAKSASISYPEHSANFSSSEPEQCPSGRIFVYDMPSVFNRELIENCDELSPWSSWCDALSNEGLGKRATGLSGIVPENLIPAWYWTDQFATELIFHNRMLNHKCRTMEAESAKGFYIPFYAGIAVGKYLWMNYTAKDRDRHCEMMLRWIQGQPFWNRSGGWDHFITMGRITWDFRRSKDEDWGSKCIYMPGMRNITRLLIERNPWDYFDVGVPYPTGFHPRSDSDILQWQDYVRNRHRSTLFCFVGGKRSTFKNDFRGLLLSHCKKESDSCRVVNCSGTRCSNGSSAILDTFLESDFCLQPRGDSFTRRSIFDCMIAGSIPVFFWHRTAYVQYEWFLPGDPRSYSVFIHRDEVKNGTSINTVLEKYSKKEVRKMREKVIDYIPKLVYATPHQGLETIKDAFDVAIDAVMRRFREHEQPGYKWK